MKRKIIGNQFIEEFTNFSKKFGDIKTNIQSAVKRFRKDVLNKKYPRKKHSY